MHRNCPESCSVCSKLACTDFNATQCHTWQLNGECEHNAPFMMANCSASCGLCKTLCQDHEEACANWAQAGECEANAAIMMRTCPSSCGLCHELEQATIHSKDEL